MRSSQVIRNVHKSKWPAEFWVEGGEMPRLTKGLRRSMQELGATLHVVPSPHGAWKSVFWDWRANLTSQWGQHPSSEMRLRKYALKPIVILLSSCEECLFLDADNLILSSPDVLIISPLYHSMASCIPLGHIIRPKWSVCE